MEEIYNSLEMVQTNCQFYNKLKYFINIFQIGPDDTINRMMLASQVQMKLSWNPPLAQVIIDSFSVCPDPVNLDVRHTLIAFNKIYFKIYFF